MGALYGYFLDYCRRLFGVSFQQAKPEGRVTGLRLSLLIETRRTGPIKNAQAPAGN